jgi:hypothetical protein
MSSKVEFEVRGPDRRQQDRRQSQEPYAGVDRRLDERRSGIDRRATRG